MRNARTVESVIAAAVEAVNGGNVEAARRSLSLPTSVDDEAVSQATLDLRDGFEFDRTARFAEAAKSLGSAYEVMRTSSDHHFTVTVWMASQLARARVLMAAGNAGAAREIVDEIAEKETALLADHPHLVEQVSYAKSMSLQMAMLAALEHDDLQRAADIARREAAIMREIQQNMRVPGDAILYRLDFGDRVVATTAIRALAALRQHNLHEMRLILAEFSREAIELEAGLSDAKLDVEIEADVRGLLAARRVLAGLYRLEADDYTSTGVMERIPLVRRKELEVALVDLSEWAARAGPRGGFLRTLERHLRATLPGVSQGVDDRAHKRTKARGSTTNGVPERVVAVIAALILAAVGLALVLATEIRNQPLFAVPVALVILLFVALLLLLGAVGYKQTMEMIPTAFVPILDFIRKVVDSLAGSKNGPSSPE